MSEDAHRSDNGSQMDFPFARPQYILGPFVIEIDEDAPLLFFETIPGNLLGEIEVQDVNGSGRRLLVPGGRNRAIINRGSYMEINFGNAHVGTIDHRFIHCLRDGAGTLLWERTNVVH